MEIFVRADSFEADQAGIFFHGVSRQSVLFRPDR